MRYEKGRKESTRQNITNVASRHFKENGMAAAGLASIMSDAGLTNGAFYAHFGSKNDLINESINAAWANQIDDTERSAQEHGLGPVVRDYLSKAHRDNPADGCPSAALLPEIARQAPEVRRTYTERFEEFIELISKYLPNSSSPEARRTARVMFGLAVGSLQLSRAVDDDTLSSEILDGAYEAIMQIALPAS